jgi:hypothetical protein
MAERPSDTLPRTYVEWADLATRGVGWLRRALGEGLSGVLALVPGDFVAEAARMGTQARMPSRAPLDALPQLRHVYDLRRYVRADTLAPMSLSQYRALLGQAFALHRQRGTRQAVLDMLSRIGVDTSAGGVALMEDHEWGAQPKPYWSQFWLLFRVGSHTVGPATTWGAAGVTWGTQSYVWGATTSPMYIASLRAVVRDWKRAASILRAMIFVTDGVVWGDPELAWGDPGLAWGGNTVVIGG